jgi:hypothetical protein
MYIEFINYQDGERDIKGVKCDKYEFLFGTPRCRGQRPLIRMLRCAFPHTVTCFLMCEDTHFGVSAAAVSVGDMAELKSRFWQNRFSSYQYLSSAGSKF